MERRIPGSGRPHTLNQRSEIDQTGIVAVDGRGKLLVEHQRIDEIEGEYGTHPVIAEAFRHAGDEDEVEPFRVGRVIC